jgi:hypothetical protein
MNAMNCFLTGEMDLEDAMLATRVTDPVRVFCTWRDGDVILGVQEREAIPVFTRIPVVAGTGPGVAASLVFDALDAVPPREALEGQQPPAAVVSTTNIRPTASPEARAGLVGALTALAKEAMSDAKS